MNMVIKTILSVVMMIRTSTADTITTTMEMTPLPSPETPGEGLIVWNKRLLVWNERLLVWGEGEISRGLAIVVVTGASCKPVKNNYI